MALTKGILMVASAIFLWSSLGVVIRIANVDVQLIIFYSNLLSLLFIAPLVFKRSKRSRLPSGKRLLKFMVLGPVTLANTFTFLYALKHTTISNALMMHYTAPILVAVLAAFTLKERFTSKLLYAIVLSTIGLWIILGQGPLEFMARFTGTVDGDSLGVLSGLMSGVAYAFLVVLVRMLAPNEDPLVLVFFQNFMMCLLLLPFVHEMPLHALWSFIVVGVLHSTIAPILYVNGLKTVRANVAAVLGYLEPVCAILFGVILLAEIPSVSSLAGGALILLGGYLAIMADSQKPDRA